MHRIISASSDTYITNKITNNDFRCTDANVGQAGTLDLFKLHDENTSGSFKNLTELKDHGVILDGFPRTIPQAMGLSKIFQSLNQTIDGIINIEVDKDVLINRLVERAKNSGRADDTEEVIINRQNVYLELTAPLIKFYQSNIITVDGDGSIEKVTERILKRIH